jgi:hypothetical protein
MGFVFRLTNQLTPSGSLRSEVEVWACSLGVGELGRGTQHDQSPILVGTGALIR